MSIQILQFFSTLNNGGAENRMMDIYNCIDEDVVRFDFAVVHEGKHFFDDFAEKKGSKKYVFSDPRRGLLKNYKELVNFFRENKDYYQAVHTHVSWYNGLVLLAAKRGGIKVRIAHSRDARRRRSLIDRVYTLIGKILLIIAATERLAISKEAAEYLYGKKTINKGKCKVIPNSVDEKKYLVLSDECKRDIRQELICPEHTKMLVTVANLRSPKNHSFLIDIANELNKKKYKYMLYLIGDGPDREMIESKIIEYGLEDRVILLGVRSDVPEILNAFDGMVFPSIAEGFGGVILEAQLCGVPVITSENVPQFTDMDVGMVKYLSLQKSASEWADEIIEYFDKDFNWSREKVDQKIKEKGFTIRSTAEAYLRTYGIDEETIKKAIKE